MVCPFGASRYPPDQLYDVVAAVDFYEDFVPWCQRSEILMRKQEGPVEELEAELEVGFKLFTESYTSHVTQERPRYVRVSDHRWNKTFLWRTHNI
jgi:coenzyme Q-binding protein COQ10